MALALGNPSSTTFILSRFDIPQTLPPFQPAPCRAIQFIRMILEGRVLILNFWVRNLPTTVIVNTHGHLSQRIMGPKEWDSPESVAYIHTLLNPK